MKNKQLQLQSPHFAVLLQEYDRLITSKNLARRGKGGYVSEVKEFFCWLEQRGITKIQRITAGDLIDFEQHLRTRPNLRKEGTLSQSSVNRHLYCLRLLVDYLLEPRQIESAVLIPKNSETIYTERAMLSVEEIKLLYTKCKTKRERAILSVAYGCGLRRNEMRVLNTNDLNFASGVLVVRKGKRNKRREVPMNNAVIEDLKDYLINERPNYLKENNALELSFFISHRGKRMSGDSLNEVVKEISLRTKKQTLIQKDVSLHGLRHSIATHLIDNGADIEFVQNFLGHTEIDTTNIYIKRRKRIWNMFNHQ